MEGGLELRLDKGACEAESAGVVRRFGRGCGGCAGPLMKDCL